jgi:hypothetical protein
MLKTHIKVFDISIKISLLSTVYQFVAHLIISNLISVFFEYIVRILISIYFYKTDQKKRGNRVHLCA